MTDTDFEELKRVCRIRGVPEPTEKPAPMKAFLFCGDGGSEDRATMNLMAQEIVARMTPKERGAAREPIVPGRGFEIPEGFLVDGKVDPALFEGVAVYTQERAVSR